MSQMNEEINGADVSALHPGKIYQISYATVDLLFRFLQRPDGRELLEKKKAELRERGLL